MNSQQNEKEIRVRSVEKPGPGVDCSKDVILPDSYRDLKKILWSGGTLRPGQAYMESGKAVCEGQISCALLFTDEEDKVCSLSVPLDYKVSCTVDAVDGVDAVGGAGGADDRVMPVTVPSLESLSVKALNPRKLGIRARIAPGIKCWSSVSVRPEFPDFFTPDDQSRVESQSAPLRYLSPRTVWERDVSLSEDFVLDKNQPSADSVLLCRCTLVTTGLRAGDGNAEYKGEAVCEILYQGDDGQPVFVKKSIPVSRILDAPGAAGDSAMVANAYVESAECLPTEDMNGQYRILSVDIAADICLICANVAESEYVTDLFSTDYVTENRSMQLTPSSPPRMYDEAVSRRIKVPAPQGGDPMAVPGVPGVTDVLGVLGSAALGSVSPGEDGAQQNVRIGLCLLYRDESGRLAAENVSESVDIPVPAASERMGSVSLLSAVPKTESGQLYVQCELRISLIGFDPQPISAVGQVRSSESDRIVAARPLTVYYPAPGESLWQIAKRYRISRSALEAANRGREPGAMIIPRRTAKG